MSISNLIFKSSYNDIIPMVAKKLKSQMEEENPNNRILEGLSEEASRRFNNLYIEAILNRYGSIDTSGMNFNVNCIHGEQIHSSAILSKYWKMDHTLSEIEIDDRSIYVDIASRKFCIYYPIYSQYLSNGIFIHTSSPFWFYPDKYNWSHENLFGKLDKKFGIISWLQYTLHAKISDGIYNLRHH